MSLIGSLEDLGLGDILQIISLSQKSGVLVIRSEEGEGRIVFLNGLVRGAFVKGGPIDLRGVLVGAGFVAEQQFDVAVEAARASGASLDVALAKHTSVSPERIDSLRREAVESAVVRMFRWQTGDFSFDVREESDPEDPQIFLSTGINAQYLAMEGSRLGDEKGFDDSVEPPMGDPNELSTHEMFGVTDDADDSLEPLDAEDLADPELEPDAPTLPSISLLEAELVGTVAEAAAVAANRQPEELEAATAPLSPSEVEVAARPVVVIDPDLVALEWIKQVLKTCAPRVHIFQRSDLGLARIRQYLARAESPIVFVSPQIEGDRLSGIVDAEDFARRLKTQSARMRVVWLREDGTPPIESLGAADAAAVRPATYQFKNPGARQQLEDLATALRETLANQTAVAPTPSRRRDEVSPESLKQLKSVTMRLNDASSRGEVLPLVISFAAESFARVAMFVVRGGEVFGMAGRGLAKAGGPNDEALRAVTLRADSSQWLRKVLPSRSSHAGPPVDAGDRVFAAALGSQVPDQAYLAPIESGGHVVALLYADNLPEATPIPDTSALEVVLHHAGLALDRAALERALAESDESPPRSVPSEAS